MTRYETFKNLTVRELAELIEEHVTSELGFCKGNCEPCKRDEVDCQHPVECCIKWLEEEIE